jgi:hypothetical protein
MSNEILPPYPNNDRCSHAHPRARASAAGTDPSSPRRLAANRRNARRSTGPRASAGKRRSSRNALKHGLCSAYGVRLPGECGATFNTFIEELRAELRPATVVQTHLFQQICTLLWRLRRLPEAQARIFRPELDAAAGETSGSDSDAPQSVGAARGEELCAAEVLARRFSDDPTRNGFLLLDRYERGMRAQFLRLLNQLTRLQRPARGRSDADSRRADDGDRVPPEMAWDARKQRELDEWFATPAGQDALNRVQESVRCATTKTNPIEPTAKSQIPRPAANSAAATARAGAKRTHCPPKSPRDAEPSRNKKSSRDGKTSPGAASAPPAKSSPPRRARVARRRAV